MYNPLNTSHVYDILTWWYQSYITNPSGIVHPSCLHGWVSASVSRKILHSNSSNHWWQLTLLFYIHPSTYVDLYCSSKFSRFWCHCIIFLAITNHCNLLYQSCFLYINIDGRWHKEWGIKSKLFYGADWWVCVLPKLLFIHCINMF